MNIDLLRKIDRVHPYPAKYTIDFALEYIEKYSNEQDLIFDPFVGSGTTLLSSSVLNRRCIGTDINYIAILISQFKLLQFNNSEIKDLEKFILNIEQNYLKEIEHVEKFTYQSINHWFCENSINFLSYIKQQVKNLNNENEKIFCNLVMSSIINIVSNQDSDTRYAAIKKPNLELDKIADIYIKRFNQILTLFVEFNKEKRNCTDNKPYLTDAKNCTNILKPNSVDLLFTSPPYINTYDYYLYHKHRMNWLEFDVKYSMNNEIGSRREYSSLKHNETKFNNDMQNILNKCDKVLKPKGTTIIVIGDGCIAGNMYDAKTNLENICKNFNWHLADYSYTLLDNTSRSFQQSYRTKGKKEHVMIFKKGT